MRSVESKLQGQKVNRNLDPKIWRCGHQDCDPYTEKNEIQRVRTSNRVKGEKSWVESVGKKSKKSIEREKKQMLPATFSSEKPAGHQIHKQAPSSCALINLVVIFTFVHGWANERERAEGKGESSGERGKWLTWGCLMPRQVRQEPRRPNSYAWLPGSCDRQLTAGRFSRVLTKRTNTGRCSVQAF
jgi:hypothetical protein